MYHSSLVETADAMHCVPVSKYYVTRPAQLHSPHLSSMFVDNLAGVMAAHMPGTLSWNAAVLCSLSYTRLQDIPHENIEWSLIL